MEPARKPRQAIQPNGKALTAPFVSAAQLPHKNKKAQNHQEPRIEISKHTLKILAECGATKSQSVPQGRQLEDTMDIHPIFASSLWHPGDRMEAQYEAIRPALVLASHFIWRRTDLIDYFVRIRYALHENHADDPGAIYLGDIAAARSRRKETGDLFRLMARDIRYYVSKSMLGKGSPLAYCEQRGCSVQKGGNGPGPRMGGQSSHSRLIGPGTSPPRQDLPNLGENLSIVVDPMYIKSIEAAGSDQDRRRCACFELAVTLVHELCHATWYYVTSMMLGRPVQRLQEPRMFPSSQKYEGEWELGWQWEDWLFKSHVRQRVQLPAPKGSMSKTQAWLPKALIYAKQDGQAGRRLLSMDYINKWFAWNTWIAIERDGLSAVPQPEFSTAFEIIHKPGTTNVYELVVPQSTKRAIEKKSADATGPIDATEE